MGINSIRELGILFLCAVVDKCFFGPGGVKKPLVIGIICHDTVQCTNYIAAVPLKEIEQNYSEMH